MAVVELVEHMLYESDTAIGNIGLGNCGDCFLVMIWVFGVLSFFGFDLVVIVYILYSAHVKFISFLLVVIVLFSLMIPIPIPTTRPSTL